jgi:hypothetical protein
MEIWIQSSIFYDCQKSYLEFFSFFLLGLPIIFRVYKLRNDMGESGYKDKWMSANDFYLYREVTLISKLVYIERVCFRGCFCVWSKPQKQNIW